jgi:REP element-mobilizing transposase RayT
MARGIERGKIFRGEPDYADFLCRLEAVVASTGVRVFAWALLPNHFHLLLRTEDVGLSTVMRRVMTGYAGAFNRRHRRHGR